MNISERLRRVTDLFVEGTEVYLGDDEAGQPVVIWVNKLNSFEVEEARRDGQARRGLRMVELGKEDNPERAGIVAEMALWDDDQLAKNYVGQKADEIDLEAYNDHYADPEQRELLETITRMPQLLDEAGVAEDDPRRTELMNAQAAWMQALADRTKKLRSRALEDARAEEREALERAFIENWRQRETLDVFMAERRNTQLFYALRECKAQDVSTGARPGKVWDHSACDHSQRLVEDRAEVRMLPDTIMARCIETLDEITVPQREAGNSDAPASSSASSEPARQPEATSQGSSPEVAPSEPPTS
jgi:hypothetical protein